MVGDQIKKSANLVNQCQSKSKFYVALPAHPPSITHEFYPSTIQVRLFAADCYPPKHCPAISRSSDHPITAAVYTKRTPMVYWNERKASRVAHQSRFTEAHYQRPTAIDDPRAIRPADEQRGCLLPHHSFRCWRAYPWIIWSKVSQ